MQSEQDVGDHSQQPRRNDQYHSTSNSFSPTTPHFSTSPSLGHQSSFIPYASFPNDHNPSGLPVPPQSQSANNAHHGYPYPHAADSPSSSGYQLGHGSSISQGQNELPPMMNNMFGAALSPNAPTNFGGSGIDSADSPGASGSSPNQNKIVQKADRSCKKCRERRVRCDRQYPACQRCTKRREQCSYGTGVFVETVEEGSDAAKIAELEQKVASLETQLKNATSKENSKNSPRPPPSVSPVQKPLTSLARESLAAVVAHAVTSGLSNDERNLLDQLLNEQDQTALYGQQNGGGGASRKEIGITCFLLDASTRACCTKLPGLHLLRDRLPYFKANLNSLDPPHRLAVVCMCAIGIRVYPNPALFGVQSVTQPDGTPIPHLFRTVGVKRDKICQRLCNLAMEGCWEMGILRQRTYDNVDALVGFVQYLIHEEGRPEDARFFVRELVGMYLDIRHEELSTGVPTKLNEANTTAVFLADGAVSSTCNKPSFITPIDLQDYFASGGLRVPDLVNMQLGELIEENLGVPLNRPGILNILTSLCLYVFSCHRVFCQVANPRRPTGSSILPFLRNLWSVLDQIHQAVQRLQQHLVNLSSAPQGYVDDPQAIDHAILLAVRADNSLVDLIMLIQVHLKEKYSESTFWAEKDGDEELERMRSESTMRVFKCLKLLAFYCQLYLASQDKHNVFHLILRLELLPNWTSMVAARIGSPGGPTSEEFEATQEELDWFRCALELACYYSPQASHRLAALQSARQNSSTYSTSSRSSLGFNSSLR
ncbi:Zn(II)2Cys6 transcription factor domain-containing protein [Sporobolomyces salmoneus]|uniref:Zn(II)2Cys6 transcription factor domain-containing protein n=1 Tax=Sporobolomyces salmoneus TaxID=183962 RepID=UPI00317CCDED